MFELTFLALFFIFGGILALKLLFFLVGFLFSGIGILVKIILTTVLIVVLFPFGAAVLGVLFSGGLALLLVAFVSIGALLS